MGISSLLPKLLVVSLLSSPEYGRIPSLTSASLSACQSWRPQGSTPFSVPTSSPCLSPRTLLQLVALPADSQTNLQLDLSWGQDLNIQLLWMFLAACPMSSSNSTTSDISFSLLLHLITHVVLANLSHHFWNKFTLSIHNFKTNLCWWWNISLIKYPFCLTFRVCASQSHPQFIPQPLQRDNLKREI